MITFPTIAEYNQSIKTNGGNVFKTLKGLNFIPARNLPIKIFTYGSGSYAAIFKAKDTTKEFAIRCFINAEQENIIRYKAISQYLHNIHEDWLSSFEVFDNEIIINGKQYPVIRMEWIDGQLINNYVSDHLQFNSELEEIQRQIVFISNGLEKNKIGHGDIQCGNIIVKKENNKIQLKLIDYDGMFVPSFANKINLEKGRTEFQHPNRFVSNAFNEKIDRFSFWVILTALEALKFDKTLWKEIMLGGFNTLDNFLFQAGDFQNPNHSTLFKRLKSINQPSLNFYVNILQDICQKDWQQTPATTLFDSKSPVSILKSFETNTNQIQSTNPPVQLPDKEGKTLSSTSSPIKNEILNKDLLEEFFKFKIAIFYGNYQKEEAIKELKKYKSSKIINLKELNDLASKILEDDKKQLHQHSNSTEIRANKTIQKQKNNSNNSKNNKIETIVFIFCLIIIGIGIGTGIYLNYSNSFQKNIGTNDQVNIKQKQDSIAKSEQQRLDSLIQLKELGDVRDFMISYYNSLNNNTFDASNFYTPVVKEFLSLKNITPTEINEQQAIYNQQFLNRIADLDGMQIKKSNVINGTTYYSFPLHFECFRTDIYKYQSVDVLIEIGWDGQQNRINSYVEKNIENLQFRSGDTSRINMEDVNEENVEGILTPEYGNSREIDENPPQVETYKIVEQPPVFPGGEYELLKYISKSIKYPPIAKENRITGTVYVEFVVDQNGEVVDVRVARGAASKDLDQEAVRVIKSLPKWTPGRQTGKAVRVQFTLPIKFVLS
jgi:TonB family protein